LAGSTKGLLPRPKLAWAEQRAEVAGARSSRYALLAAKAGEQVRAKNALAEIEAELAALGDETSSCQQGAETPDELAERQQIGTARQAIAAQHEQQAKHYRATLDRLKQVLALPEPYDEQRLIDAGRWNRRRSRSLPPSRITWRVRDAETLLTQQATAAGRSPSARGQPHRQGRNRVGQLESVRQVHEQRRPDRAGHR
jgi:exonuclease SbcC